MADNKITEKFSYLTSILSSYSGAEQRIKLRDVPSHLLSYNYSAMNSAEAQWLRAHARQLQSTVTYIPMWQNVAYLSSDFLGGKSLYMDKDYMYGFHNCDAIEIFRKDDVMHHAGSNMTKIVKRYDENVIVLKNGISDPMLKENTYILPLIRCATQPASSMSYVYSNGTDVTMNFEDILYVPTFDISPTILSEYDYTGIDKFNRYNLPLTLDSREMFLYEPQWDGDDSLQLSIDKLSNKLENKTGVFKYDLKNNKSYDKHSVKVLLTSRKMINNMIRFFHRVSGRYKSFYCPTWANDFDVVRDIKGGDKAIYTKLDDLYRYYLSNGRSKKIAIFTKDGKSYIHDILTYSQDKVDGVTYGKVLLTDSQDEQINLNNIAMVSFLNLVRLDSDDLQINYESNVVADVTLTMKEVDD